MMKNYKKIVAALLSVVACTSTAVALTACSPVESHDHVYGDWQITAPTQSAEGKAVKNCSVCNGITAKQEVKLPKLGDEGYTVTNVSEANCLQSGVDNYSITVDGKEVSFEVITPASGHAFGELIPEVPATQDNDGKITHYICGNCGTFFDSEKHQITEEDTVIPALKDQIPDVVTDDVSIVFTAAQVDKYDSALSLIKGVKVTATSEKDVEVLDQAATVGDKSFTYALLLGGKANADSRHIAITVDEICVVTLYVEKNTATQIAMYTSTENITSETVESVQDISGTAKAYSFTLPEAGTYYFGTPGKTAYVYGIDIVMGAPHVHSYDEGVVTTPATCIAEGVKTYTCVCGNSYTEPVVTVAHQAKDAWEMDEYNHWHECKTENCIEVLNSAAHEWDGGEVTEEPTETEEGAKTYTCTVCSQTKTENLGVLEHKHAYSEEWSGNETHHWYASTCGHDVKDLEGEHEFDGGEVTKEPTEEAEGETTYTCDTCNYKKVEKINKLYPAYSYLTFDENDTATTENFSLSDYVIVAATSDKPIEVISKSATVGDKSFTHALSLLGKVNVDSRHIAVTVEGTCTINIYAAKNKGSQIVMYASSADITAETPAQAFDLKTSAKVFTFSITEAGTYYFGTLSSSAYVYGIEVVVHTCQFELEYTYDETNHWYACENENCLAISGEAAHSYDEGVVTTPATGATAGEKTYTCTACPQTKTEEIPATGATTTSYEFSQLTTGAFTENLTIDENIVVTATSAKKMQIKSGSATVGDTTFTNFLYLEGKANTDSRHIAITVDGPCTVTLYVAANGATQIAMYTSTANITDGTPEIVYDITTTAAAYTFTVEEAGTYYFGTPSSSAYVYGIDITVVS